MKTFRQVKNISNTYACLMRDVFSNAFEDEQLNKTLLELVRNEDKTFFAEAILKEKKQQDFFEFVNKNTNTTSVSTDKTPYELLDEAWYILTHIKNKEELEPFYKYYHEWELICSMKNPDRFLNEYHWFMIVKKDLSNIKRVEEREHRRREDDYWTSVCSIKIAKKWWRCYITNRYNHWVDNCDNTFNSNLDNIIEWLYDSFCKMMKIQINKNSNKFEVRDFIYHKWIFFFYNYEINNIYYWIHSIIKNDEIINYDPSKYFIFEYFVLDLQEKKIVEIDKDLWDSFTELPWDKVIFKEYTEEGFINDKDEDRVLAFYLT